MKLELSSLALRTAVSELIAEQMADALLATGEAMDLSDFAACRNVLVAAGFGSLSINAVGKTAVAKAVCYGR